MCKSDSANSSSSFYAERLNRSVCIFRIYFNSEFHWFCVWNCNTAMLFTASSTWKWGLCVMPYDFYCFTENRNIINQRSVNSHHHCTKCVQVCISYRSFYFHFFSFQFWISFRRRRENIACVKHFTVEMTPSNKTFAIFSHRVSLVSIETAIIREFCVARGVLTGI